MWRAPLLEMVLFALLCCHLTLMSVTLYLHRAVEMHPRLAHVFRAIVWLGAGMRTVEWVAYTACTTPAVRQKKTRTAR